MIDIRFRAWDKLENKMIYDTQRDNMIYWDWVTWTSVEIVNNQLKSNAYEWMQYTWLNDKLWNPIYVWDIVKAWTYILEILKDDYQVTCFRNIKDNLITDIIELITRWFNSKTELEIIWNIYESPELLNN